MSLEARHVYPLPEPQFGAEGMLNSPVPIASQPWPKSISELPWLQEFTKDNGRLDHRTFEFQEK